MKKHYLVILLGLYMLAMGVLGYVRTGSTTPIYITGSLAVVTILLGLLLRTGSRAVLKTTIVWIALNVLLNTYMTVGRVAAHAEARPGSKWIFGSMAFLALLALAGLLPELRRRRTPPNL